MEPVGREGPSISGVVDGASFGRSIAPGGWATITGTNLAPIGVEGRTWKPEEIKGGILPESLEGITVRIGGTPGFLYYVSATQLNVLVPVRKLPAGQLVYERRNGQFVLPVTGHPEFGVPFGQDRIVPIFLATLAVRQKSQTIRFKTAAEMLETFGMHKGGKEYRRLVAAFERIFGATMFFGTDSLTSRARVVQRSRFNFLREAQIWYNRQPDQRVLSEDFENVIVLSDEFYQEIVAHPIPTDLEAAKVLAGAPAVLDLFMWLTYRCFVAKGSEAIPIFGPYGLVTQIGSVEYSRERRFVAKLEQWLSTIRVMWPACPARVVGGRNLVLDRAIGILQ